MKNIIQLIKEMFKAHFLMLLLYMSIIGTLAVFAIDYPQTRAIAIPTIILMFVFLYLWGSKFEKSLKSKSKLVLVFLLIGSMVLPSSAPELPELNQGGGGGSISDPQCGAGGCVAVIVVAFGAYIIYKIVKFCQKKFPKDSPTEEEDNLLELSVSKENIWAAAYNFDEIGSCSPCEESDGTGQKEANAITTIASLTVSTNEKGELVLNPLMSFTSSPKQVQDFAGFQSEISKLGVIVTGHAGSEYFSHNGEAVTEQETPFRFREEDKIVKVNFNSQPSYTIIVERTWDFQEWTEVLRTEVEVGTTIVVEDTTSFGQQFYRFSGFLSD